MLTSTVSGKTSHAIRRRGTGASCGFLFCLLFLSFFAMGQGSRPPADTTPPIVSITSPANNSTVSATITIQASATDNIAISKVDFYIDNTLKSTDTSSPYSYAFDTTAISNGTHTVKVTGTDTSNNTSSAQIIVTVSNVPPDPELSITSASASGSNSAHPPQAAIDNNNSTYWQGN